MFNFSGTIAMIRRASSGYTWKRPRVTELRALGEVVNSGMRRENASGRSAIVWRVP